MKKLHAHRSLLTATATVVLALGALGASAKDDGIESTALQNQAAAEYGTQFRNASIKSLFGGNVELRGGGVCGDSSPDAGEQCDDGNTANGDGCSSTCQYEAGFDCTDAVAGSDDENLVTDGSLEDQNIGGDWTTIDHSLFGTLICGGFDGNYACFNGGLASPPGGGDPVDGFYFLVSGGSFTSASTGVVEHAPITITPAGATLTFSYLIGTVGDDCAGPGDGLALLIDGIERWSNTDGGATCTGTDNYVSVSIDLAALGLNDGGSHTIRFEGTSSAIGPDVDLTNIFLDEVVINVPASNPVPPVPSSCSAVVCGDGAQPQFSAAGSEACDDGNTTDGDGCSAACEVEQPNFICTDSEPANAVTGNDIEDGSLEDGSPNADWDEAGTQFEPICSQIFCGAALANTGAFYAWFGGSSLPNDQALTQEVVISSTATSIDFELLIGICDSVNDRIAITVDGTEIYGLNCVDNFPVYTPQSAPLGAFADGNAHTVEFTGSTVATNGGNSNFFIDDIRINDNVPFAGEPSSCFELFPAVTVPEQFEAGIPGNWTVINLGPSAADGWGTSNDGLCAGFNWSGGNADNNVTGGGGVAACADSDATGQVNVDGGGTPEEMDTYLCSPAFDPSSVAGPRYSFLANYQAADNDAIDDNGTPDDNTDDRDLDLLEVLIGTTAPNALTVPNYTSLGNIFDHLDSTLALSEESALSADLSDFATETEAYACFHYRGTYAWFAQIDNPALRGSNDTDGDGITDDVDNCITLENPSQLDTNGDGYGNRCDADLNNDCIVNAIDLGLFRTLFFLPNNDGDINGDGITNAIDLGLFRTLFFQPPGPSPADPCTP